MLPPHSLPRSLILLLYLTSLIGFTQARPLVRHIHSEHEFDRLLQKHATQTGLPVIVDFYSDGCGPCRMMAPVFKNLAREVQPKAVFAKVDTNQIYQLSGRYGVRSIPTFIFFLNGKKVTEFSGAGEGQLRQFTETIINKAERENVVLKRETLEEFYERVDGSKSKEAIEGVYKKCAEMMKDNKSGECIGPAASQLKRRLKSKYGEGPELQKRFTEEDQQPEQKGEEKKKDRKGGGGKADKPNLHLASKEELQRELEARLEAEMEAELEEEDDDEAEFEHGWSPGDFPERVTIIGGGPAGISAAIYVARAGLSPVVVAPPMGGQLQGKGVDVENYPGMINVTGPAVISAMRNQAASFGTAFEAEMVMAVNASSRPLKVITNSSVIETHAIIVATGAESNWLNIPGEYEMRGGGVSSCAICDGAAFYGKDVLIVGGGDAAMEDALVLARTSKSVTVIHRRDTFRASKILAQRVMEHPSITIKWNTTIQEILGTIREEEPTPSTSDDEGHLDLDNVDTSQPLQKIVTGAILHNSHTDERYEIKCDGVFIAIGHTPATSFLEGIVEFDSEAPGYVKTFGGTTRTSFPGIFAAGDVADSVYRQAITSAGSGAAAALDAERWLSEEGLGNERAEFEAELMRELMGDTGGVEEDEGRYNAYDEVRVKGVKESVVGTGSEL